MKRLISLVLLLLSFLSAVVAQENGGVMDVRQERAMPRLPVADSLSSQNFIPPVKTPGMSVMTMTGSGFYGESYAVKTPGMSLVTMPYQFSGRHTPQYIVNWNRFGMVADHRSENYPNLMEVRSAMMGVSRQGEHFSLTVYGEANKYLIPLQVTNQFGVGGSMSYRLNDHVSMTLFGMYYTSNPYFSMAAMPFTKTSRYGGYFTFEGEKVGIDLGAERYYDAFAHRWVTTPIVTPSFKVSPKFKLQLPLGGLVREGLQRLFWGDRQSGPTIMPHIER